MMNFPRKSHTQYAPLFGIVLFYKAWTLETWLRNVPCRSLGGQIAVSDFLFLSFFGMDSRAWSPVFLRARATAFGTFLQWLVARIHVFLMPLIGLLTFISLLWCILLSLDIFLQWDMAGTVERQSGLGC